MFEQAVIGHAHDRHRFDGRMRHGNDCGSGVRDEALLDHLQIDAETIGDGADVGRRRADVLGRKFRLDRAPRSPAVNCRLSLPQWAADLAACSGSGTLR
jgi:hypothetical protein